MAVRKTAPDDPTPDSAVIEAINFSPITPDDPTSDTPAAEAIEPMRQASDDHTGHSPPPPRAIKRVLRRLVWLLAIAAVALVVAVGIFYGWPFFYDRIIRPVETNTAELSDLRSGLERVDDGLSQLETRTATIESGSAVDQADIVTRVDSIEAQVVVHTERLDSIDALTAELETGLTESRADATHELALLRSMELLSRARLFLYQANYGLAAVDLQSARDVLVGPDMVQAGSDPTRDEAVFRIDLALLALPDRPVAAADDLDIAWQALLGEIQPSPRPAVEVVPAPGDTTATTTS